MCMLDTKTAETVRSHLSTLIQKRKQFTGRTVFDMMAWVGATRYTSQEISAHVRMLFNNHDPVFQGYSCYPIENGGPLMFFPTPYYAKKKAEAWGFKVAP